MAGDIIELNLPEGGSRAYVARSGQGSGPGLLLLGDSPTLDPSLRDAADLYAEEGYVVLAPEVEAKFAKPAAAMAHTRSVAALRRVLGPHYDLAALWERHCLFEFGERDVPKTMATMVAEPYVNHVPTMTGGVGQQALARFYRD